MNNLKRHKRDKIPKDWQIVKLKKIISSLNSGIWGKNPDQGNKIFPVIRSTEITHSGKIILSNVAFRKIPEEKLDKYHLIDGDILLVASSGSSHLVGRAALFKKFQDNKIYLFSNFILRLRPKNINSTFLFYYLSSPKYQRFLKSLQQTSTGLRNLPKKELIEFRLLLPPLPEQQKIAEILSTVDKAIEKVDKAIDQTKRVKKGLMQELLTRGIGHKEFKDTDIGRIPKKWDVFKIRQIADLQYGYTTSSKDKNTGIKFLRISDINKDGKIDWERVPYCEINESEFKKYKLNIGDVLFARIGATTGKTAYVDRKINGIFASYLIRFISFTKNLDPKFFYFFTQSNIYWLQVQRNKEGQLKKGLNANILGNLLFPLPPLPEQQKIAEILSTVDERLELLRKRREKLEKVKKGLMNDLLTGKKRVKLEA